MSTTKSMTGSPLTVSVAFYIGVVGLAFAVGILTYYINNRPYVVAQVSDPAALSRAEDAYANVGNLLTTLATGLLAAIGWFFTSLPKRHSVRDLWPAIAGVVFACLSIYFGYISSQNVQWLIENSIATLDLAKVQLPRQFQFFAILLSVFFFADFVRRDWAKRD